MWIYEPISLAEVFEIVSRTVIIFLYAFLLLRLLGRRRLSHLTYTDVLVIVAFGSAVGDVMIYDETVTRFFSSLLAITVVAALVKALDEFSSHSQRAQGLIEGRARLLIDNGKMIKNAMAKENLSEDNLLSMLRQRDVYELTKVKKVFIEPDGELSIVLGRTNGKNGKKKK